ncbi:MAG: hypothetical protein MZV64_49125 [Ignavibacteriales bacterium]|nr:hypothetical protein [Ignavibacteriales bacterium]
MVQDWKGLTAGRHIYPGIAAYRPEIQKDLAAYIDSSRAAGLHGQVFFRWENMLAPRHVHPLPDPREHTADALEGPGAAGAGDPLRGRGSITRHLQAHPGALRSARPMATRRPTTMCTAGPPRTCRCTSPRRASPSRVRGR